MRVVTLMGSPRPGGNTATLLGAVEESLGPAHDIERHDVAQLDITGCRGCYACAQSPDEPGCVQRDDATAILDALVEADAVVYATPLYMWGIASDLRAMMERHLCLVKGYGTPAYRSLLSGKKAAFIVTAAGPRERNADAVETVMKRFASYAQYDTAGIYVLAGCSDDHDPGDELRELAARIARELTG